MVANSAHDMMMTTVNSLSLADHLRNGQLRLFPNAAHGFPFQYPTQFAQLVTESVRGVTNVDVSRGRAATAGSQQPGALAQVFAVAAGPTVTPWGA
jgi:hypothetical protein